MKVNSDSDSCNSDEIVKTKHDLIDSFEFNESDIILDFYYDLKGRFSYFIDDMNFCDLLNFIIDQKFSQFYGYNNNADYNQIKYFDQEYSMEINTTLWILNNFLKKYKRFQVNYNDWFEFCYNFTTIKKPTKL